MRSLLRCASAAQLVLACAAPSFAQSDVPYVATLPEPLPMGIPYFYQPGNPYWYAPAIAYPSPYPWGATTPIYGRYVWDYTGHLTGYTIYSHAYYYPHYGYSWIGYWR